jgi:hypothetical protein
VGVCGRAISRASSPFLSFRQQIVTMQIQKQFISIIPQELCCTRSTVAPFGRYIPIANRYIHNIIGITKANPKSLEMLCKATSLPDQRDKVDYCSRARRGQCYSLFFWYIGGPARKLVMRNSGSFWINFVSQPTVVPWHMGLYCLSI